MKSKFIDLSDKNYSYDALPIYSENAPTVLRSQTALDTLKIIDIEDYLCEETMLKISVKRYMLRLQSTLSPSIKRGQSPLALAWESTVDKVQGLSLDQGIADFDLKK